MDNIATQRDDFHFSFFPQNPSLLLFKEDTEQESEPLETIHKLRKFDPLISDTNSHNIPQSLPQNPCPSPPTEAKVPIQPEKSLIKPICSNIPGINQLQKYLGKDYPIVVRKALAKLQPLSVQPYQVQLEQMRLLGIHQEKEVENHIILRKGNSVSTTTCSPSSSLRSSFHCMLSPGNEEELKINMVDNAIIGTDNKDSNNSHGTPISQKIEALSSKNAQMQDNISPSYMNLRRTASLPPEANALIPESSTPVNLMNQPFPLSPEITNTQQTREQNTTPMTQFQNLPGYFPAYQPEQVDNTNWNSHLEVPAVTRCLSQGVGENGAQGSGKSYRSLVDSQMQAIQSLFQNKRSFSQMNYSQNTQVKNDQAQIQSLGAQRVASEGPALNPRDNEAMKRMWIQRWHLQRAVQHKLAMEKQSYLAMQENLMFQNDQSNGQNNVPADHLQSFQENSTKLPDQRPEFRAQETAGDGNIDHFFVTSESQSQQVPQSSQNAENSHLVVDEFVSPDNKGFLNTEHFLASFSDDLVDSNKKIWNFDEDSNPFSLRSAF